MKILKAGSSQLILLAVIAGAVAFQHFYMQQKIMFSNSPPVYDRKYGAAIEALSLLSCIALVLGNCLKKIERRLDKLERSEEE